MLNIPNRHGNANQNYIKIPSYTNQHGFHHPANKFWKGCGEKDREGGRQNNLYLFLVRVKINTVIVKINLEIFQIKNRTTK